MRRLWREFPVERQLGGPIVMSEFVSRCGRRNLGFAWLFCEPLVLAFPVMAVWSAIRSRWSVLGVSDLVPPPPYDLPYWTFILTVLTTIGLWPMREVRKHLERE